VSNSHVETQHKLSITDTGNITWRQKGSSYQPGADCLDGNRKEEQKKHYAFSEKHTLMCIGLNIEVIQS